MHEHILAAMRWRYAVKEFDSTKPLAPEHAATIVEAARLAPSSLGIEPWKFLIIENTTLRQQLREAAYGQSKVTDAPLLIVLARRTDVRANISRELMERTAAAQGVTIADLAAYQAMVDGRIAASSDEELDAWARSQVYIPLGIMVETAALLQVDACPMEGFSVEKVNDLLGLPEKNLCATAMIAFGYRAATDIAAQRPKVRRATHEVIEHVR